MAITSVLKDTKDTFVREKTASSSDDSGHESSGSTDSHIFSDPDVADYWRKKYEAVGYENVHRFDPTYTWTAEEEKRLVKKVLDTLWLVTRTCADYDRSIGVSLLGHGSCSAPSTSIVETLIAPSLTTW